MSEGERGSPAVGAARQLTLAGGSVGTRRPAPDLELSTDLPVARVVVDLPLPHLDRPFDYGVPASMAADAQPGVRVKVRFAGRDVDGFVVERLAESDHPGRLAPLRRVMSAERVLTPEVLRSAREVAVHYAGGVADVLRLAIPPRHARAEKRVPAPQVTAVDVPTSPVPGGATHARAPERWADYDNGPQLLAAIRAGGAPGAVWSALPGADPDSRGWPRWPGDLAAAVRAAVDAGRGALVVVPDRRDVDLVTAALDAALGPGQHVALTADLGPEERYRRWLAVLRGTQRVVVGTRSAAFAPVDRLGLAVVWDDGDDLHVEPRAPYPHVRDVLLMRARTAGAAAVVGGLAVTAEGAELLRTGAARAVRPRRPAVRAASPMVRVAGDDGESDRHAAANRGRLPGLAFDTARAALAAGPVLVQVPRGGYVPALACARCRTPARCPTCHGPLRLGPSGPTPTCAWCARPAAAWRCPECTATALRAPVVGALRTAEELGRAFPSVPVVSSGGEHVRARVDSRPALVVATPGAEPVADGGYAAALLLDAWLLLGRADLRAGEEALRRWLTVLSLVRAGADGGRVVLVGPPGARAAQALVRGDPFGAADRELADRAAAGFPPAVRVASLTGPMGAVTELLTVAELPQRTEVLGPVPLADDDQRFLLRAPLSSGPALAAALRTALALRSARKSPGAVRVQLDPLDVG